MKNGLKFLLWADAWSNFAVGMIGPIYAIFVQQIGGDILDASWAYFTFMFTSGVVMYLIGTWEDRVKHKEKLIVIGYSLTAVGCFGYIFVSSQLDLLLVQIVMGLALAVLNPAFDASYAHFVISKREASEWGTWESMGYIVAALSALAGGYLAYTLGFRVLFVTMTCAALIGALISLWLLKGARYLQHS